uniref:Alpha-aminoadipic semialdehyde synthase n=1 Tax=Anthurium amnicola TaxID=1678845 RepID=A0A1D1Z4G1_9ARAE
MDAESGGTMLGNGVVGILSESCNIWERRAPLTPSHCARLLLSGRRNSGVDRIIVQPSTKRIHHDSQYEDAGCEISDDLSECGLVLGIKQPKLDMILPNRAYSFFSHTHKAQRENMPLLDKILAERVSLYDYELIVGDNGKRQLAFGKFAGRAGLIDFLHGLGKRYLNLGYSTPFLSLGASHMYSSLAAAKAAVITLGEEIATMGLPSGICPIVFVFTGSGNVSQGAQEIFKLLPHTFVDPRKLPELMKTAGDHAQHTRPSKRVFQVYGCVVTCQDMVAPKDPTKLFDKADYYAHPERYNPVFHERIAPYASVIVNCMYWEKRFPRLLSTKQLQELVRKRCPLVGVSDITCDVGGSLEFVNQTTSIERPFFRYNPITDSYHDDMYGEGVICLAVDILPTEFPREASQHFGDILSNFIGCLASTRNWSELPPPLRRACISDEGKLTHLYEYIPRMRNSSPVATLSNPANGVSGGKNCTTLVSLSGHLFDQFLINEALDIIEAAGGSFRLVKCEVGQNANAMSYSELEVGADDVYTLEQIVDSLSSIASNKFGLFNKEKDKISLKVGKLSEGTVEIRNNVAKKPRVLILGAGRVCQPAAELLVSVGRMSSRHVFKTSQQIDDGELEDVQVVIGSLYVKDAEEVIEGIPNTIAVQLDVTDHGRLSKYISDVDVVISLLPASFHLIVANKCIEHKKHLVTASYVDDSMSRLDDKAKSAGITILCEMGLDPGIDHMMAMKMIDQAHSRKGKVRQFVSYCGGLPSPEAANNPLAYKFSWNPAGAIRAGRNSATYKYLGKTVHVDGAKLYDSATRFRIPDLPAFALEYLPNRNSLVYGDLYGINNEASTIFRATLRYEGFSEIMGTLAKIGFFDTEVHPVLKEEQRPTFGAFLSELLKSGDGDLMMNGKEMPLTDEELVRRIVMLGHCKETTTAMNTVKAIRFLGLNEDEEIPLPCRSAFDVACQRMEERLTYSNTEQDMVLLHHEVEVDFPDGRQAENHRATLLEYGRTKDGKMTSAMALTVGVPAAIGALLLLGNKVRTTGVIRPLEPEVYIPALEILQACGIGLMEKVDIVS